MNPKIQCRRIIGVIIIAFVISILYFLPTKDVLAANKNNNSKNGDAEECKNYLTNTKYLERYNVSFGAYLDKDGNVIDENKFVLELNPDSSDETLKKALQKVVFKIVKINGVDQSGNVTVAYKKPAILNGSFVKNADFDEEMSVVLESTESSKDPNCTGKVIMVASIIKGGNAIFVKEDIGSIADYVSPSAGEGKDVLIDCSKTQTDEFNKNFCEAKIGAKGEQTANNGAQVYFENKFGGTYDSAAGTFNFTGYSDVVNSNTTFAGFKCDPNKFDTSGGNYYLNKRYLYGSGSAEVVAAIYKYHYSPASSDGSIPGVTEEQEAKCTRTCEEAVTVEYGPPVASKAGLCFEYKVKVTSRVSCHTTTPPKPKVPDESYSCTPTPLCTNSTHDYLLNQGGPNEEFDACIKECDGGKYTDKCTAKCYKKVYGKATSKNKKTNTAVLSYETKKLAADPGFSLEDCKRVSHITIDGKDIYFNGCYYRVGNSIRWSGINGSVGGRWYSLNPHKDYSDYGVFGDGFYRHKYSGGEHCHDNCWWSQCSNKSQYLNPGIAKLDKEKNEELYHKAVDICSMNATCTTTSASFTISVSYNDGTSKKWIDYPYSREPSASSIYKDEVDGSNHITGADCLSSKEKPESLECSDPEADKTVLLSHDGCYLDRSERKWYQAEWSFPGSWIHNKTGEITYVKPSGTYWQHIKDKFCLPLNAQNVNVKWWTYRQKKEISKTSGTINYSANSEEYRDKCGGSDLLTWTDAKYDESKGDDYKIDYNIKALTSNFGYFGWRIKVECFYALNTGKTTPPTTDTPDPTPKECIRDSSYRIRTVDLTNLFPATDGDANTSRTPGFNWSEYAAKNKDNENPDNDYFVINPGKYAEEVQRIGDGVYSDAYLDYHIRLTPELLKKLRDSQNSWYVKDTSVDTFSENYKQNYVINYKSPLWNGVLSSSENLKHPTDDNLLRCNNIGNNQCETYGGD